jgi:hypothetical protein
MGGKGVLKGGLGVEIITSIVFLLIIGGLLLFEHEKNKARELGKKAGKAEVLREVSEVFVAISENAKDPTKAMSLFKKYILPIYERHNIEFIYEIESYFHIF